MTNNYTHITLLLDSSGSMETIREATIENYNKFVEEQKKVEGKATLSHFEFSSGSKYQNKNARETRLYVPYLPAKNFPEYDLKNPLLGIPNIPIASNGQLQVNTTANLVIGAGHQINIPNGPFAPCVPSTSWTYPPAPRTTYEFSCVENFVDIKKARSLNKELYVPNQMTPLLDSIGRAIYETGEVLAAMKPADRPEKVLFVIITDGQENASVEYSKDDIKAVIEHQTNKYSWDFIFLGANMDAISVGGSFGISAGMSANFAVSARGMSGTTATLSEKVSTYRMTSDVSLAKSSLNYSDADRIKNMGGEVVANTTFTGTSS